MTTPDRSTPWGAARPEPHPSGNTHTAITAGSTQAARGGTFLDQLLRGAEPTDPDQLYVDMITADQHSGQRWAVYDGDRQLPGDYPDKGTAELVAWDEADATNRPPHAYTVAPLPEAHTNSTASAPRLARAAFASGPITTSSMTGGPEAKARAAVQPAVAATHQSHTSRGR